MSCIRDIRLLIARHLDLPTNIRTAVLNVLNVTDSALDAEGWQEGDDVKEALKLLDAAILGLEYSEAVEGDEEEDDDDLIDIDDIEVLTEEDDDGED